MHRLSPGVGKRGCWSRHLAGLAPPTHQLTGAQPSHLQNGGADGTLSPCLPHDRGLGRYQRSGILAVSVVHDERPKEGRREGKKYPERHDGFVPRGRSPHRPWISESDR